MEWEKDIGVGGGDCWLQGRHMAPVTLPVRWIHKPDTVETWPGDDSSLSTFQKWGKNLALVWHPSIKG